MTFHEDGRVSKQKDFLLAASSFSSGGEVLQIQHHDQTSNSVNRLFYLSPRSSSGRRNRARAEKPTTKPAAAVREI